MKSKPKTGPDKKSSAAKGLKKVAAKVTAAVTPKKKKAAGQGKSAAKAPASTARASSTARPASRAAASTAALHSRRAATLRGPSTPEFDVPPTRSSTTGLPALPSPDDRREIKRIISIPDDVVLSPSSEMPRHSLGQDRSTSRGSTRELSWSAFERYVQELARTLRRRFEPDAVIGVAHGGVFVGGALASALQKEFFPVRITRRSRDLGSAPEAPGKKKKAGPTPTEAPRLIGSMPEEIRGLRVLIVDDIASSGDTLELATRLAVEAGARATATAALVARPNGFDPDFRGMTTDELVVFPWDYQGFLPDSNFDDRTRPAVSRRIRQPLMASPNLDDTES